MVNKKGGKKHKRNKSHQSASKATRLKEEGQEYAQIRACKGNCRFDLFVFDGKERLGILCGSMRKRRFVNMRDVVLVSIRDFEDAKCDIIDVYDDTQVRKLKQMKEIPPEIKLEEENEFMNDDTGSYQPLLSSDEEEDEVEEEETTVPDAFLKEQIDIDEI